MDEKIEQYIVDIVFATRFPEQYNLGTIKGFNQLWRFAQGQH